MKIEPTFDFELDIDGSRVRKLVTKITLKNTNKISAESKIALLNFRKEIVLKTFQLRPFTILIAGVPVPIAKQWIAIVLGIDGNLTARVTAGAQNINTATAGIIYENSTWGTINNQENSFTIQPFTFEGAAKIEPWLQVRYEVRPYGVRESRIYVGIRGSVIGEATTIPTGLSTSLKWGIKFSAKVQMQIWERSVLNYEQVFFEREFLISQSNTAAFPTLTTTSISNITQATAQSGGVINSDGGAIVTVRGVCWSPIPNPTTINSITTNGSGTGSFSGSLTGLLPNTTYYVRAYATNSAGTGYGNEVFFTSPNPTLPSLEALWSFDNCTANDFSGNNHHGIYPGGSPKCQSGINSNSSCFSNDSSDYFDTPGNLTINSSAFSVSYWVKFLPGGIVNNQPGSSAFFQIIDNITGVNNAIRFYNYTYLTNPNQSYWTVTYLQNGVDTHVYTNPNGSNLTNGNWHHFALTCSNGTVNYYLDGNVFLTLSSPSPIYKRIAGGLDDVKNVCLDQIRYYNVPLTPTQVQYIYNNQL